MTFFNFSNTKNIALVAFLISTNILFGQAEKKDALKGNEDYQSGMQYLDQANVALSGGDSVSFSKLSKKADKHFLDAEVNYKKALDKNQEFLKADFNLGDALYKQGRYDESINKFEDIIKRSSSDIVKGSSHHNIGNAHLQSFMKDPQENKDELDASIESYKNALRYNPNDAEARYNLEMTKRLKYQQQQQQQQEGDEGEKGDKNKDQEQQKGDKKEDGEGDKKEEQKSESEEDKKEEKEEEGEESQPKESEMTKEEAERLLEALKNEEEKLQEKLKKKKAKGGKKYIEKDW